MKENVLPRVRDTAAFGSGAKVDWEPSGDLPADRGISASQRSSTQVEQSDSRTKVSDTPDGQQCLAPAPRLALDAALRERIADIAALDCRV